MTDAPQPKPATAEVKSGGYLIAPCPHCGASCVWGYTPNGARIPLSRKIPVYTPIKYRGEQHAVRTDLAFASHFFDCPNKEKFLK